MIDVHTVIFRPDGLVEITYQEERDVENNGVALIRSVVGQEQPVLEFVEDVQVAAAELVDALLELKSAKPQTRRAGSDDG